MGHAGIPDLIWEGGTSPHGAALKPSQIRMIEAADVIFNIGANLEASLTEALERRQQGGALVVSLIDTPGLKVYTIREGGLWPHHEDEDTDGHTHDHQHGSTAKDPHIWLDPKNAKAMVLHIANVLAEADPENAENYRVNAASMIIGLNALGREIADKLAPVRDRPFVVFHDGYQYFERRFGLTGVGAITVDPDRSPGARRLKAIRDEIVARKATCVFAEPQFDVGYIDTVAEGTGARMAILDPLGVALPAGKEAYASMLWTLATSMAACLSGTPKP